MKQFTALFALTGFALLILAGCAGKDNTLPPAPLAEFKPTLQVEPLWSTRIGKGSRKYYLRMAPAISGNTVFVDDYDGDVVALEAQTGKTIWQANAHTNLTSGVTAADGKLFMGSENGAVVAFDQVTGARLWVAPVGNQILAAPAVTKGMVLVKTMDGILEALSETDGRQLWRFTQDVPALSLHAESQPVISGNVVVAGFANGKAIGLNVQTGKLLWSVDVSEPKGMTDIERMIDIDSTPVIVGGVVYVGTYQGNIAAIGLQSGRMIWRHEISTYAGIAADAKNLYVSDAKSYVWGFDQDVGAILWRQDHLQGRMISGPALSDGYVIVADGYGYAHWMTKAEGHFAARVQVSDAGTTIPPVVANHLVLIYTRDGKLYAFREMI
ncbi:MAG: outer membrane protein assembly factor BamB [Gammaproteobacteria bacterium GWF2_41_13]|nr:MAG: outer membrane protein assembly factor BamB [Gammaproteobacteria bacterium GWF2_41_13]